MPSLLYNAETWTNIDPDTENVLEKLQNAMFRALFAVPKSTPKPILRSDLGNLTVRENIHVKKLTFIHHLKNLKPESLGAEIYDLQVKHGLPGLVNECRELLKLYRLPDIIDSKYKVSKNCWKNIVKKAVIEKSFKTIRKECMTSSKLKNLSFEPNEKLEVKDYVKKMSLVNARTFFRIRSQMVDVKMNQKSSNKHSSDLWKCDFCFSIDSQSHIMWCPAFSSLREGKNLQNDLDVVTYFQDVLRIRSKESEYV